MVADKEFVLIFANGEMEETAWVESYLAQATAVIAADGGIRHLTATGHLPDVLIGDLDSLPEGTEEAMAEWDMEIIRHPADKDETDLELALLFAADRYPRANLMVAGALGGRMDHTLATIQLLAHPDLIHRPVFLMDGRELAWAFADETVIAGQLGDIVSLIPLGGPARVAATSGLRWPLREEVLAYGAARGVSNEMTAGRATVRLESGMLLCVHMKNN